MKEKLDGILQSTLANIEAATDINALNDIKVAILGKKGELTQVLKSMKDVAPEDRPKVGQMVNDARQEIEASLEAKTTAITRAARAEKMKRETIDVTLPGVKKIDGHRHPNQIALEDLERVFIGMGYEVVEGPEVEYDKYNFELLNIPANHPAKDEQDTFYINKEILLRTQTSPVQARIMEQGKLPIRILSPGRVFRSDEVDATHSPSFHQVEGLVIDKNITMADLKGTLEIFIKRLYGEEHERMDWLPYLTYIAKKPRSLRNSGIYDMMPQTMQKYMDNCENRERGRVLKILAELTAKTGFASAVETVDEAVRLKAMDPDSLQSLYRRAFSDVPLLPPLENKALLPQQKVIPFRNDLVILDAALKKGGASNA